MKKSVPTLYLFNNIFYPLTVIPLTVTDNASKQMLLSSYQNNTNIALFHPHPRSMGIGTLGKIILIDYDTDKNLTVVVQGLTRIKLLSIESEDPFPQYFSDDYYDLDEMDQVLTSSIERLNLILFSWINRHVRSTREREHFMRDMNSPAKLINNLCMFIIKDIELKQIFLESTSLIDRIQMMNALLVGENPESENIEISEAIKKFERLEIDHYKNVS